MDTGTTRLEEGSPPVLHVSGEIDLATADELRAALRHGLSEDSTLVVDMADVTFIDARGLRVIFEVAASLDGAKPLTLVNAPLVARLCKLVGLTDLSCVELREAGELHGR